MQPLNSVLTEPGATVLGRGILYIGIGKHGSKPLPIELIEECRSALLSAETDPLQKGAFVGALIAKGPTEEEKQLESVFGRGAFTHPTFLINKLCPELPTRLLPIGTKLLRGHTLRTSEAHQLGNYLFSDEQGADASCETFRAMATSILRVRHETNDEYNGLYQAAMETITPGFQQPAPPKQTIIQLAEPFDGVEHSYLITPLLANHLQKRGYGVISSVGRTAGPKYGVNAHDLYLYLGCPMLQSNHELNTPEEPFGWVLDQKALSPVLDRWVDRRRSMLKRPFLATLEKVLNPCHARVLVTSVFHITYQMKMAELALMAGFDAVVVMKRGLEGSLAPSTSRSSGILCAVRTETNHLFFQHFDATLPVFNPYRTETDDEVSPLQVTENMRLVREYLKTKQTGNSDFDNRVRLACLMLDRGMEWIAGQLK